MWLVCLVVLLSATIQAALFGKLNEDATKPTNSTRGFSSHNSTDFPSFLLKRNYPLFLARKYLIQYCRFLTVAMCNVAVIIRQFALAWQVYIHFFNIVH